MKISTKGRYGLQALLDLALHSQTEQISLKSIAARCELSETYILQIFLILRRAGIVKSIRGAHGGYQLARVPATITVNEVLTTLEGVLAPVDCLLSHDEPCTNQSHCVTRHLWSEMQQHLTKLTSSITLADLIKSYQESFTTEQTPEYYL